MVLKTARYPIISDGENQIVKLLIKHTHDTSCHSGVEQPRALLMENYWILRCRVIVKQTVRQCIPCRQMLQDAVTPQMADLPVDRLPTQHHQRFQTPGLDFAGPFPVKENGVKASS